MEIIILANYLPSLHKKHESFAVKLVQSKDVWLFNCTEGCQHTLAEKNIKINHITKIIFTELHIDNICGLIGLLSSLNLVDREQDLEIYGPHGIDKHVDLAKKYSQTNFQFNINIHLLKSGLAMQKFQYKLYAFTNNYKFTILTINQEKQGKFKLTKAVRFGLVKGPLYGKLKMAHNFLVPDGTIIRGSIFKNYNQSGNKISLINQKYHNRIQREITKYKLSS